MEVAAYRIFYDNIHDFKETAVHVEKEIKHHGIRNDSMDAVPGMKGRTHHDMWVSMKTVSHFNLGTALELMLKLLLFLDQVPLDTVPAARRHYLSELHDAIPPERQEKLEVAYRESKSVLPDRTKLTALLITASTAPQTSSPERDISTLKGLFQYLDEDARLWEKRYSWELVDQGRWAHYFSDISVFVELIDRVMRHIDRP